MAENENLCQTAFSEPSPLVARKSLEELREALAVLDAMRGNVQNCNCAPSNCCQTTYCQACQACQTCQYASCQKCQSSYCQSCQQCNCAGNNGG